MALSFLSVVMLFYTWILLLPLLLICHRQVYGWTNCSSNGSICPDRNTCCPTTDLHIFHCITGTPHSNLTGDCCTDDQILGTTGCGPGYVCAYNATLNYPHCRLVTPVSSEHPDILPRYRLGRVPDKALREVYGFPIDDATTTLTNSNNDDDNNLAQIGYYSTLGAMDAGDATTLAQHARVETVVIVIHGSARNADDYLLCTHTAASRHNKDDISRVMVIAPWLRTPLDPPISLISQTDKAFPLEWAEDGPIAHTWRYGADALNAANFSAYAVLDVLLQHLHDDVVRFPRLRRIVVAGHSAGGQYVQRWALLSNSPVLNAAAVLSSSSSSSSSRLSVRAVVANPRSFCFLDHRRYIDGIFQEPSQHLIQKCPDYNAWEWGFGNDTDLIAPYKDKAIAIAGGVDAIVERYQHRRVIYLAGELDTEKSGNCRARLQGQSRKERSEHFLLSLHEIYGKPTHERLVVHGVHHDHCLMFQSEEGRQALFGLK